MIPPFNSNGKLPPGVHFCLWEEFITQFGTTQYRLNLIAGLKIAMEQLQTAGCLTIYVDGSFVTNKLIPGDFDACWNTSNVDTKKLISIAPILFKFDSKRAAQKAEYGGGFFPANGEANGDGTPFLEFFQNDRDGNRKGIIAIDLLKWQP